MAVLVIEVDQRKVVAALKKLNDSIEKTGKKAEKSFDKAGASIGAVSGVVGALTEQFIQLGVAAVKTFLNITAAAVNLNKEAELTKLSLIQIFGGSEAAADAFIETVGDLAIKLGTSRQELTGLAKGILPDVGSIEGTAELLENVIVLGRDAGQGIQSIRIATEEALSGNLQSLGRRLNIPAKTLDSIREYQKEMSLADAINKGLGERILETGISADVTAESLVTLQGKVTGFAEQIQLAFGAPIFEEAKVQLADIISIFEENEPEIKEFAEAVGQIAANILEVVGLDISEGFRDIDFQSLIDFADNINRAVDALELLFNVMGSGVDEIENIDEKSTSLADNLVVLAQAASLAKAVFAELGATWNNLGLIAKLALGQISADEALAQFEDVNEAFDNSLKNSLASFDTFEKESAKTEARIRDRKTREIVDPEAGRAEGEAFLAEKQRLEAAEKAAKAQDEIDQKRAEAAEDRAKKLTDIARKEAQKRFDDEVKNAQKREDIARKNADALEDIFRKQDQTIAAEAKDLSREEQDIARKGASERKQIEKDAANERVEVERNFRQQLQDIQRSFNQSAQDAERTNDAQAFLQAVRARDEQIEVAKQERDVSLGDVGRGAQEQRADLKEQLAQEVEDSKIANTRKLEDLQTRLNQELEQQAIKNERDLELQAIQESRQRERRDLEAQRTLENFERAQAEKEAKLNESLEKQFAILEAAAQKELGLLAQAEAEKTKIVIEEMARRARALRQAQEEAAQTSLPPLPSGIAPPRGITPMAEGSDIAAGQTALVGEKGMEMFTAPVSGRIIPNHAMFSPPGAASSMPSNINNSRSLNVEQMGISPGDGILSRMVQTEVSKMLELLG